MFQCVGRIFSTLVDFFNFFFFFYIRLFQGVIPPFFFFFLSNNEKIVQSYSNILLCQFNCCDWKSLVLYTSYST